MLVSALAPTLVWLAAGFAVWAAANSVIDVVLNAQGVELGARYGRPVLSGLQAGQGVGLLGGALAAAAAAALDVSLIVHVGAVAVIGVVVGLAATAPLLPQSGRRAAALARPNRRLLLLGGVAFCAFAIDGVATNWVAAALRTEHHAGPGVAAAGYLVFAVALVLGRVRGDLLVTRFGPRRVVAAGGLGVAIGTAAVVFAPAWPVALLGWALVGVAVGPLAPTTQGVAAGCGGPSAPVAIAAVTTLGYLGSVACTPLVGVLAEFADLSTALLLLVAAGIGTALLGRRAFAAGVKEERIGT